MECLNMPHFLFFLLFEYLALAHGKTTFIDNFGDGSLVYGHESSVKSFAKLSSEVVSPLPSQFTICSAINIQTITTMQPFFQVSNWNNVMHLNLFFCNKLFSLFTSAHKYWELTPNIYKQLIWHIAFGNWKWEILKITQIHEKRNILR